MDGESISDAVDLVHERLIIAPLHDGPRRLLVHVTLSESPEGEQAYCGISVFAVQQTPEGAAGVAAFDPLMTLHEREQQAIRTWLISRHWPAWARASETVRRLLGSDEPAVSLAEAARTWMLPLSTLTTAAEQRRLPTIQAGERRLVYPSSIGEAQDRGLLHVRRGRPPRQRKR